MDLIKPPSSSSRAGTLATIALISVIIVYVAIVGGLLFAAFHFIHKMW